MNERKNAMYFGGAVYVGVVVAASTLFISFILTAFPKDAYFSRVIMTVAGALVGCSMLAFPYTLHNWAISGDHRKWTTILYYGEMLIIGINTIVAFGSLLAEYKGYKLPEWAILYEPFSIGSIVYTLFAWGTIFRLDPQAIRNAKQKEFDEKYEDAISNKQLEFLGTVEGEDAIMAAAINDVQARVGKTRGKQHFGSKKIMIDPEVGFVEKEQTVPLAKLKDGET